MRLTASPSRTTIEPGSKPSAAFGETLAKRRIFSRSAFAAFSAALPEMKVWREAEVLPASGVIVGIRADQPDVAERHAERIGEDLRDDSVGALADVDRALVQHHAAVARNARLDGRGVGDRGVAAAIPARGHADAALPVVCCRVERLRIGQRPRPVRLQRFEAGDDADAASSFWPVTVWSPSRSAFFSRKASRSMPSFSASSS